MPNKTYNLIWAVNLIVFILIFTVLAVCLAPEESSDEQIEQEKQRLYEIEKTVPKDLEQIALIEDVNISITPNDEIELTFLGDECELQVKYTTNYEKLEENFRDKRERVIIIFGCAGAAVGAFISLIFISLSIKIWEALDSSKEKRKKAKIQKQEEKIRKKQEKEKRKQKIPK